MTALICSVMFHVSGSAFCMNNNRKLHWQYVNSQRAMSKMILMHKLSEFEGKFYLNEIKGNMRSVYAGFSEILVENGDTIEMEPTVKW